MRPVPFMKSRYETKDCIYAEEENASAFLLEGGVEIWKHSDQILEIHPDGLQYIWWNPNYILSDLFTDSKATGSYLRQFPGGAFEGRSHGRPYRWAAAVPREPTPFLKEFQTYWTEEDGWEYLTEEQEDTIQRVEGEREAEERDNEEGDESDPEWQCYDSDDSDNRCLCPHCENGDDLASSVGRRMRRFRTRGRDMFMM